MPEDTAAPEPEEDPPAKCADSRDSCAGDRAGRRRRRRGRIHASPACPAAPSPPLPAAPPHRVGDGHIRRSARGNAPSSAAGDVVDILQRIGDAVQRPARACGLDLRLGLAAAARARPAVRVMKASSFGSSARSAPGRLESATGESVPSAMPAEASASGGTGALTVASPGRGNEGLGARCGAAAGSRIGRRRSSTSARRGPVGVEHDGVAGFRHLIPATRRAERKSCSISSHRRVPSR